MENEKNTTAYISNDGDVISFSFGEKIIRFRGPYSLVRFDKVKVWDNGYIVLDAYYNHSDKPIEEYIDLIPIIEDLYISPTEFLGGIESLEVRYA